MYVLAAPRMLYILASIHNHHTRLLRVCPRTLSMLDHEDAGDAGLPDGEAAAAAAAAGVQGEGVEAPWDDDDGGAGGGDDGDDGGGFDALDLMHDIGGHRGASPWGDEGGGGEEGGSSYEDLCRAHIEAMVNAAAAQEVQSELAQRVSGWRTKIDPVLKDEEGRSNFDIQMYAERIIKRLQDATHNAAEGSTSSSQHVAGFEAVAKEDVSYEVSRTFAAMLQLINNRNIELVKDSSDPDAPFRLQLLMDQLPHKRMAETLHGNIAEGQELASLQDAPEEGDAAAGGSQQAGSKRPPKKKVKNGAGA
ncbi:hypothetical protein DUNSADRAFT_16940 [Dunaliella salina]|uniref:Condensin-2 complex subunit H2 C-terminal domain-containing protein n=1 Tax=Dunaliella salina TaxID=3046 RepID=A0ABQ7H0M5_DUNSA|nr:hypothetical protein DUNSADRAFT_16940 [Dunaliella salina]|eukprot:KAF5840392.1 hypothetical protein DUNSADRAFT_16940 [Dunaliella salina]